MSVFRRLLVLVFVQTQIPEAQLNEQKDLVTVLAVPSALDVFATMMCLRRGARLLLERIHQILTLSDLVVYLSAVDQSGGSDAITIRESRTYPFLALTQADVVKFSRATQSLQ